MKITLEVLNNYESKGLLYSSDHPTLPLRIYNYTDKVQWEGLWDDITMTCRGLVVDFITGDIVARPFKKFFNLSEGRTNITENYRVFEKLDGSLGILFYYYGEWVFASRGSFISEQAVWFKGYFLNHYNFSALDESNTYCFEIIYKENRVVVKYEEEGIVLTGVFNTTTGEELSHLSWGDLIPVNELYNFPSKSLFELSNYIADDQEGYVVLFDNGERCKIKGAEYLRLHKLMSELSTTSVWECLYNNTPIENNISKLPDEFFQLVKDYEYDLRVQFNFLYNTVHSLFSELNNILGEVDDKKFAITIVDNPFKSYFFALRNGKDITQKVWKQLKPKYRRL